MTEGPAQRWCVLQEMDLCSVPGSRQWVMDKGDKRRNSGFFTL